MSKNPFISGWRYPRTFGGNLLTTVLMMGKCLNNMVTGNCVYIARSRGARKSGSVSVFSERAKQIEKMASMALHLKARNILNGLFSLIWFSMLAHIRSSYDREVREIRSGYEVTSTYAFLDEMLNANDSLARE